MQEQNRRTVLGLMASTGLTALAGCSALGGGSSLSYEDWMPERDEDYAVFAADVTAALDADVSSDAEDELAGSHFSISTDVLDIDDVGAFASVNTEATVCTYTVDRADVREELEAATEGKVEVPDAPEGYEAISTFGMLFWLGDDYLIAAREPDLLEALYDTYQWDKDGYTDDDALSALDDQLSVEDVLILRPNNSPAIPESTGFAYGWSFESETADFELVVSFVDEDAAEDADLSALTESVVFTDYDDLETTVEDSFGILSGSVPLSDFDVLRRDGSTSNQATPPQVSLAFEYTDGERIDITHDGGESIDVETITIQYEGTDVSDIPDIDAEKPDGDWSAGKTWTLTDASADGAFASGDTVQVFWTSPTVDSTYVLGQFDLP